jgi:hypothetical protein
LNFQVGFWSLILGLSSSAFEMRSQVRSSLGQKKQRPKTEDPRPKTKPTSTFKAQVQILSLPPRLVLLNNSQRSREEIEFFAQTILQIAQVGKMQAGLATRGE